MFAMFAMMFGLSLWAANYITQPSLKDVVKTPYGPVTEGTAPTQLPIITWGGDIATILANGNAVTTVKGSAFDKDGLNFKLVREDIFVKQLEAYISGKTPYLRGTLGQINMAAELLAKDPRLAPTSIYQMTWSRGGDCLVVRNGINKISDLKGKVIVLQAYSPHVEFLTTILEDAGLKAGDVTIKYVKDLTGTDESPAAAIRNDPTVDAVFCISPDAFALTSNGTVGNGAEQSVKGAKILFSTKSASKIIPDLYAVRADYFGANPEKVAKFVHALLVAEENLGQIMQSPARKADCDKTMAVSAKILLDSEQAAADAKGLYSDCEFVGYTGNVKFFASPNEPRRFESMSSDVQVAFIPLGLLTAKVPMMMAGFDYEALKNGLTKTALVEAPKFQAAEVAKVLSQKTGDADGAIYSFEIMFRPNQNTFDSEAYKAEFDKVVELAATYGGAIITIEGHSDPLEYLKLQEKGAPQIALTQKRQSAKNLSLTRAVNVRESLLSYAKAKTLVMDPSQFAVVGRGFEQPKTGTKNGEPNRPKTEAAWLSNMRVEFRLIPVGDTESSVFTPAGGGQ
jgi:outer membrane protein OmpA-like peptidoglycan-associated protein